jgi:ABC-type phosphate/phosphonate transport system ATPase subunit
MLLYDADVNLVYYFSNHYQKGAVALRPQHSLAPTKLGFILMQRLNREKGVTFLFTTHDPRVMQHARRVIQIADGTIVNQDPMVAAVNVNAVAPSFRRGLSSEAR